MIAARSLLAAIAVVAVLLALAAGPSPSGAHEATGQPAFEDMHRAMERMERQVERMRERLDRMQDRMDGMREHMAEMHRGAPMMGMMGQDSGHGMMGQGMVGMQGSMAPGMAGQGMAGTDAAEIDDPVVRAFREASFKMHRSMNVGLTGDADRDFVVSMIPHHQGAIDMARIVLEHGKDDEVRKLAEAVIAAQEAEIAQMRAWLEKHPAP